MRNTILNKAWWEASLIRAIKTFFQTAISVVAFQGASQLIGLESINWLAVLSCSALASLLSLMTSLAGIPEVEGSVEQIEEKEIDG